MLVYVWMCACVSVCMDGCVRACVSGCVCVRMCWCKIVCTFQRKGLTVNICRLYYLQCVCVHVQYTSSPTLLIISVLQSVCVSTFKEVGDE